MSNKKDSLENQGSLNFTTTYKDVKNPDRGRIAFRVQTQPSQTEKESLSTKTSLEIILDRISTQKNINKGESVRKGNNSQQNVRVKSSKHLTSTLDDNSLRNTTSSPSKYHEKCIEKSLNNSSGFRSTPNKLYNSETASISHFNSFTRSTTSHKNHRLSESLSIDQKSARLFTEQKLTQSSRPNSHSPERNSFQNRKGRRLMITIDGKEIDIPLATKKFELTQRVKNEIEERKELVKHFMNQGSEKYASKLQRKDVIMKMKALTTRLHRLEFQVLQTQKELQKAEELTTKTIQAKNRHLDDLNKMEERKQAKVKKIEEQKELNNIKRKEHIENLKLSLASNNLRIANIVSDVKLSLSEKRKEYQQKMKEKIQHQAKFHKKIRELEQRLRESKIKKHQEYIDRANQNHSLYVAETERLMNEFQEKMDDMIKLEEALLQKINATNQLKASLEEKREKITKARVVANQEFKIEE